MKSYLTTCILPEGDPPPQKCVPQNLIIKEMFLYAAWVHGMSTGDTANRYSLFAYIQSHLANKSIESLQGVLEKSRHWGKNYDDKGSYILLKEGHELMLKSFGHKKPTKSNLEVNYVFTRRLNGKNINVIVEPGELKVVIDDEEVTGKDACHRLKHEYHVDIKGQELPATILNWIIKDNDYKWKRLEPHSLVSIKKVFLPEKDEFIEEDDALAFPEGRLIYELHRSRERDPQAVKSVKKRGLRNDPLLCCQVCGFSFVKTYGELGKGFIEAHHTLPLSELSEEGAETKPEDIVLVCSNCHRMLHRHRPWLTINSLKKLLVSKTD